VTAASEAAAGRDAPGTAMVAIETATETVGVAVRTDAGMVAEFALTGRRRHVETLTPALAHLLDQLGLTPRDLGVVAVDIGPGLFTGLRVGVAAAKGLAQALGIGVVTATSLDVLTAGAAASGHTGLVLACIDARRGEVFAAVYDVAAGEGPGTPSSRARVRAGLFTPAELSAVLEHLGGAPVIAVGDGAQRYADVLRAVDGVSVVRPALSFPSPAALLDIARAQLTAGVSPVEPGSVVPLYMREADARINYARAVRTEPAV
jgi:tRNA threonylcarbamoyladenosine biosynthesis protein TsaB